MKKQTGQLTNEELASFCSQISILLHAGITPGEGVRILMSDTEDEKGKALLNEIFNSISDGNSFTESLDATGVFPDYVVNTLKLGEEVGSMDEVMQSLALYYDRECQIEESIKSAVTYPLIMILMMLVVIVILLTKVLPIFNQVYVQLGSEMTGFAASLMQVGNTLNSYSVVFIAILVILIGLYIFFSKTASGRKAWHRFSANLIFTKHLNEDIATGRFASGMALALSAGLDTFQGIDMVKKLVEHKGVSGKIDTCRSSLSEGDNLAEALKKADLFSNVNNRMVAVGIKTGETDAVMRRIADEYERRTEKKINETISVIEPTLVIVLSVIVGLILLSVILPLMGIMSTIG